MKNIEELLRKKRAYIDQGDYEAAADIRDQIEMNSFHFDQVIYDLAYLKSTQEIRIHFPATFIVVQDYQLINLHSEISFLKGGAVLNKIQDYVHSLESKRNWPDNLSHFKIPALQIQYQTFTVDDLTFSVGYSIYHRTYIISLPERVEYSTRRTLFNDHKELRVLHNGQLAFEIDNWLNERHELSD
jgi:hypothetical protein